MKRDCGCPLYGACLMPTACTRVVRPPTEAERLLASFHAEPTRKENSKDRYALVRAQVEAERRP